MGQLLCYAQAFSNRYHPPGLCGSLDGLPGTVVPVEVEPLLGEDGLVELGVVVVVGAVLVELGGALPVGLESVDGLGLDVVGWVVPLPEVVLLEPDGVAG